MSLQAVLLGNDVYDSSSSDGVSSGATAFPSFQASECRRRGGPRPGLHITLGHDGPPQRRALVDTAPLSSLRPGPALAGNGVVYLLDSVLAVLPNVAEAVDLAPNLNTFSRALNASGVGAALGATACPDPVNATCNVTGVTVLAPIDAAFESLARSYNLSVDQFLALPQARNCSRLR